MAESYPQEQPAAPTPDSDYQRLLGRLRQDEVQLAADQRQLRQQRVSLDRLKADLDARQQELDAALAAFQQQRQAFESQKRSGSSGLDAQRAALFRREEDLTQRAAQLDARQADLLDQQHQVQSAADRVAAEQRALEDRRASLDRREADLQALVRQLDSQQRDARGLAGQREHLQHREEELREQFEGRRRELEEQVELRQKELVERSARLDESHRQLAARVAALREQEATLNRDRQALDALRDSLKSREAAVDARQAGMADLLARSERLAKDREELDALQQTLRRRQEQQAALDARLAERERQLQDSEIKPARQLQALQAEAAHLRQREQAAIAQRNDLSQQCDALQARMDEMMAAGSGGPATPASSTASPDAMAALAAQAARTRRRGWRADAAPRTDAQRAGLLMAAAVAVLVGGIIGLALLQLVPARYWLEARIGFAKDSPLASSSELARAQRDLGGRLAEARVPGMMLPQDRPPVTADIRSARLAVQVMTVAPDPSRAGLADLLARYRSELEGNIRDGARLQQDRELADLVAATQVQIDGFTADRQALLAQAAKFEPLGKAYDEALALAEKTRKELDEANRKNEDIAARLRVLRRTPPGARVELSAERLAAATAGDVQFAEVHSQVTARADELRTLLDGLLTGAAGKCDQMDAQLDKFLEFLTSQQDQLADPALRDETAAISGRASQLKGVVRRCRQQIQDLSGVLAAAKDVAQATSLVAVQAQSEKALESLTFEAADQIKKVDGLLEKIPAGGADVTRRTVLQQRLRSRFAEVQKTQHEMVEMLNTLRPAVNFRLDAALTAVSGLARRLQDRQKALVEQIQQQDAQSRRIDYDRQLQQAQAESDELGVERDRLMTRLTEATQDMLDADPGRTRLVQVRARIDDLDRKLAAARTALEDARRKQTSLQAAATQPAVASLDEPQVVQPAANRTVRIAAASVSGLAVAVLVFIGYMAATASRTQQRTSAARPGEMAVSRN